MKVIIYNDSLRQIPREQVLLSYPGPGVRSPRPAAGFAAWAGPRGGYRAQVCDPGKVRPVIRETLAFEDPALVDIGVGPNVPRPSAGSPTTRPGIGPDLAERPAAPGRRRHHAVQGQKPATQVRKGSV